MKSKTEGKTLIVRARGKLEVTHEPDCFCAKMFREYHDGKNRGVLVIGVEYGKDGDYNLRYARSQLGCPAETAQVLVRALSEHSDVFRAAHEQFKRENHHRGRRRFRKKRAPRGSKKGLK